MELVFHKNVVLDNKLENMLLKQCHTLHISNGCVYHVLRENNSSMQLDDLNIFNTQIVFGHALKNCRIGNEKEQCFKGRKRSSKRKSVQGKQTDFNFRSM